MADNGGMTMSESAGFETVTPEIAALYLRYNTRNRVMRPTRVERYSGAMKRGEWKVTHQGIAFGLDGTLYDGQHRLAAIVDSKTTQRMLVIRGLSVEARLAIDTGDGRMAADNLSITDGIALSIGQASWLNSIVRVVDVWYGGNDKAIGRGKKVSAGQLRAALKKHSKGFSMMQRLYPKPIRGISAPVVAAFIYAAEGDAESVAGLWERFVADDHKEGDPMGALRKWCASRPKMSDDWGERRGFYAALKCIAEALDGIERKMASAPLVMKVTTVRDVFDRFGEAYASQEG